MDLHLIHLNWAARYLGIVFGIQGLLLIWSGLIKDRLPSTATKRSFLDQSVSRCLRINYLPIGRAARHDLASVQLAGLAPTPLTILTMGVLLLCSDRTPSAARDPDRLVWTVRRLEPRPLVGPFAAGRRPRIFFYITRARRAQKSGD